MLNLQNYRTLLGVRGRHRGEQAVAVMSGPSAQQVDLGLLAGHPFLLGANASYRLMDGWRYYFCSSSNFYVPNEDALNRLQPDLFFYSNYVPYQPSSRRVYLRQRLGEPVAHEGFSSNLLRSLPWGPTILLDLIVPVCVWMGFEELVLVGADYPLEQYRRFYDGEADAPQRLYEKNNNHEMALAHRSFDRLVSDLDARSNPLRIVNCSPGSALSQFPRHRLEEVV